MKTSIGRFVAACIVLAAAAFPSIASAQGVPRPNDLSSCAFGDTGQFITLPNGTRIGITYPESLNCGAGSLAGAPGATAVGVNARATGAGSVAIGRGAVASFDGSVALGDGARATAPNQVAIGGPGTSVRIGDIAASTAAQSGPVGMATVDGFGTLGVDFAVVPTLRREIWQGVAAAVAIAEAPMPSAPGRTSYAFNVSTFRGEEAMGGSIMHRLSTSNPFAISVGFSYAGNGNNAARVGIAGEF